MPDYRLYRLDPLSGQFVGVEEVQAADDRSAIHEIQQRGFGNAIELWEGGRKVTRIDAWPEGGAFPPNPAAQPLY